MKKSIQGSICLLCGTVIWGSAFVAQSAGMERVGPFTFQAARCRLAVLSLCVLILFSDKTNGNLSGFFSGFANFRLWKSGVICGAALFAASSLQQLGLVDTDAGKAGFLTAMYIVLVPILGLFLGKKPGWNGVLSLFPAVAGLYLLSCAGGTTVQTGDILLLGAAVGFAVQILMIDRFAAGLDALRMNAVQCLVCGVLSVIAMAASEKPVLQDVLASWLPIGYAGVLSMGVAYSLQIFGQQRLNPTASALLMSLESVFAALSGWLILHESMTAAELCGCALVFAAVILSQLPLSRREKARVSCK